MGMQMFDLILFAYNEQDANAQYCDASRAQQSFFASAKSLQAAKVAAKNVKFLHVQNFEADAALASLAAQNNCAIVIAVSDLACPAVHEMAKKIARARKTVFLALHYGAPIKLCTLARNEMELRNAHEMAAIGMLLGLDARQAKAAVERK